MYDPLTYTIEVPCDQQHAFETFLNKMESWWPLDTRAMSRMAGSSVKSLMVEAKLGGKIVETSEDGSEYHWATIRKYDPFGYFSMDFHMGLPADQTGLVAVTFTALSDKSTKVELTHSNWEGYGDMMDMMYQGYSASWGLIFEERFKAACAG